MEGTATTSARAAHIEKLLDEQGRTFGPVRIAFGRSGVALGFPKDPMLHISWWALAGLLIAIRFARRRSSK